MPHQSTRASILPVSHTQDSGRRGILTSTWGVPLSAVAIAGNDSSGAPCLLDACGSPAHRGGCTGPRSACTAASCVSMARAVWVDASHGGGDDTGLSRLATTGALSLPSMDSCPESGAVGLGVGDASGPGAGSDMRAGPDLRRRWTTVHSPLLLPAHAVGTEGVARAACARRICIAGSTGLGAVTGRAMVSASTGGVLLCTGTPTTNGIQ